MKNLKDTTEFEKEILKQEIDLVDKTIARIDHIQLTLRNWAVVIWGGSLYLVTENLENPAPLILLTAIIPLLFGMLDMIWTRQMLIVNYREEKIADFINGKQEEDDFSLLDPIAKKYRKRQDYIDDTSFKKAILHKGMMIFYLSLVFISLILGLCLIINTPEILVK